MKKILAMLVLSLIVTGGIMACDTSSTTTTASGSTTSTTTVSTTSGLTSSTTTTSTVTTTTSRVFTLTELAEYDGTGGTTAYIAVNGIVYDVTDVADWNDGWHKGMHLAGTECTAVFDDSPHSLSFLNQLTIVGTLAN